MYVLVQITNRGLGQYCPIPFLQRFSLYSYLDGGSRLNIKKYMNIYFTYDVIRLYSISYICRLRDDVKK